MSLRRLSCVLMAAVLVGQAGCCCGPWGGCWPHGKNWCGSQCGEFYWNEWFSLPPQCCDPCDDCGNFCGRRHNDALYSHGNDYVGYGDRSREAVQRAPVPANRLVPAAKPYTPAETQPYAPRDNEPPTLPGPSDDVPPDSSTEVMRHGSGRPVAYDAPRRGGRPAYGATVPYDVRGAYRAPVDSWQASRKLGKPPRTRLFSP